MLLDLQRRAQSCRQQVDGRGLQYVVNSDTISGAGIDQPGHVLPLAAGDALKRVDRGAIADLLHHGVT